MQKLFNLIITFKQLTGGKIILLFSLKVIAEIYLVVMRIPLA